MSHNTLNGLIAAKAVAGLTALCQAATVGRATVAICLGSLYAAPLVWGLTKRFVERPNNPYLAEDLKPPNRRS